MTTKTFDPYERYASHQDRTEPPSLEERRGAAQGYDKLYGRHLRPFLAERGPGAVASLDIGCGPGFFLNYLKGLGVGEPQGIDFSAEQVARAKASSLAGVRRGDATALLRREKKTYDLITAFDVLEHVPTPDLFQLVAIVRERLKVGGLFIAQVPNALCPLTPTREADITHLRAFSPTSLRQVARMGGFTDIRLIRLPLPVTNGKTLARRLAWELLVEPVVRFYGLVQMGNGADPIYTGNLALLARK